MVPPCSLVAHSYIPSLRTVHTIWAAAVTSFLFMTSFYRLCILCAYWLQDYPVKNTEVGKGHLCSLRITCIAYLLPLLDLRFCGFWDCNPHIPLYFGNIFLYFCAFFLAFATSTTENFCSEAKQGRFSDSHFYLVTCAQPRTGHPSHRAVLRRGARDSSELRDKTDLPAVGLDQTYSDHTSKEP